MEMSGQLTLCCVVVEVLYSPFYCMNEFSSKCMRNARGILFAVTNVKRFCIYIPYGLRLLVFITT